MRKFYDTETQEVLTEEELVEAYEQDADKDLYPTFSIWLREITGKNGTLIEVRPVEYYTA